MGAVRSGVTFDVNCRPVDLSLGGVPDEDEENPGGFLCVNYDDDDANGIPDVNDPGPTIGEEDLKSLTVALSGAAFLQGTMTLSCEGGCGAVRVFENPDRSSPVTLPSVWNLPSSPWPKTLYVEGVAPSTTLRDVVLTAQYVGDSGTCDDRINVTVIRAEMNPITSGVDPIPYNPAIVAPMTPLLLDNGVLFWDANSFELTTLQPSIDLATLPVTWTFSVTSGFLNAAAEVVVASDKRSARLMGLVTYSSNPHLGFFCRSTRAIFFPETAPIHQESATGT